MLMASVYIKIKYFLNGSQSQNVKNYKSKIDCFNR